ncbi:MAG: hypothetical protein WCJ51_00400 [Candidatus Moraniibacteriota bacterium]
MSFETNSAVKPGKREEAVGEGIDGNEQLTHLEVTKEPEGTEEIAFPEIAAEDFKVAEAAQRTLWENLQQLADNIAELEKANPAGFELPLKILGAKLKNLGDKLFSNLIQIGIDKELIQEMMLNLLAGVDAAGVDVARLTESIETPEISEEKASLPEALKEKLNTSQGTMAAAWIMFQQKLQEEFNPLVVERFIQAQFEEKGVAEGARREALSKGAAMLMATALNTLGYGLGKAYKDGQRK